MNILTYFILTIMVLLTGAYIQYDSVKNPSYKGVIVQKDEDHIIVVTETDIEVYEEWSDVELNEHIDSTLLIDPNNQTENIQIGDKVMVRAGRVVNQTPPQQLHGYQIKKIR